MRFLILTLFTLCTSVACAGDKAGNGGDPVALSFRSSAEEAIAQFETSGLKEATPTLVAAFKAELDSAIITATDEPLLIKIAGQLQDCTVVNDASTGVITVSMKWDDIADEKVKLALAIHELAGLTGHEASGIYNLSAAFLRSLGYTAEPVSALALAKSRPHTSPVIPDSAGAWLLSRDTEFVPNADIHLPAKTLSFAVCGEALMTSENATGEFRDCDKVKIDKSKFARCNFQFQSASSNSIVWQKSRALLLSIIDKAQTCGNCDESSDEVRIYLRRKGDSYTTLTATCEVAREDGSHAPTLGELKKILGFFFDIKQPAPIPL